MSDTDLGLVDLVDLREVFGATGRGRKGHFLGSAEWLKEHDIFNYFQHMLVLLIQEGQLLLVMGPLGPMA